MCLFGMVLECATTTSEEETACRRQPGLRRGCQVHAVSSVDAEAAVRRFFRCGQLWALDPAHAACSRC